MANSLSASFPDFWSRRMQVTHHKKDVYVAIANMEEQETLKRGDTLNRPYRSSLAVNTLGAEGNYSRQDITDTNESLTINQEKEVSFYIREIDEIQSNYKTRNEYADDAARKLGNQIDGDVLGEYDQATDVIGLFEIDGTGSAGDGVGFTISTSNVLKAFIRAGRELDENNIGPESRFAVISPQVKQVLFEYLAGKDTNLADEVGANGKLGRWAGFDIYQSTNTGWSAVLACATLPTDADTVTINGVVFTFETGTVDTAGEVKSETDADTSFGYLKNSINTPGTSVSGQYSAVSAANQALLKNIVATHDTSANTITLKGEGWGYVAVSETLTAAADVWTTTKQIQHNLFGQKGATDLVIQKRPNVKVKERDGYIGADIVSWTVYGLKTFTEGKSKLVDLQVRSDAF